MPVFWSRGGISVPSPGDKAEIASLEFTETCPELGLGSQASPCEGTDLPCTVGLSTGPDTFHRLRSCVRGSRTGVRFRGCQNARWVGVILVCICVKLQQCREKWGCCADHVHTLTVHEQAAFHYLGAEYVISPGKGYIPYFQVGKQ